jgi:hypothetical protein
MEKFFQIKTKYFISDDSISNKTIPMVNVLFRYLSRKELFGSLKRKKG